VVGLTLAEILCYFPVLFQHDGPSHAFGNKDLCFTF